MMESNGLKLSPKDALRLGIALAKAQAANAAKEDLLLELMRKHGVRPDTHELDLDALEFRATERK